MFFTLLVLNFHLSTYLQLGWAKERMKKPSGIFARKTKSEFLMRKQKDAIILAILGCQAFSNIRYVLFCIENLVLEGYHSVGEALELNASDS